MRTIWTVIAIHCALAATAWAQGSGIIEGRVIDDVDGRPIPFAQVLLFSEQFFDSATADSDGRYRFEGLPPADDYRLRTDFFGRYIDEVWDDHACDQNGCDLDGGTALSLAVGERLSGIDFRLDRTATIGGTIRQAVSGAALPGIRVIAFGANGDFLGNTETDTAGGYRIENLLPGDVRIRTEQSDIVVDELYDDMPCTPDCDIASGTPITVGPNDDLRGIDFDLDPGSTIVGVVQDADDGTPVSAIEVFAYAPSLESTVRVAFSDSSGRFALEALPAGTYLVGALQSERFAGALWQDGVCSDRFDFPLGGCAPGAGLPVEIGRNQAADGITLRLERLGSIAGRVTRAEDGTPIESIRIEIDGDRFFEATRTDRDGRYAIGGLADGVYTARADAEFDRLGLIWDGILDDPEVFQPGTPVVVALGDQIDDIDFAMPKQATITGTVQSAFTGLPLPSARIRVFDAEGRGGNIAFPDSEGRFVAEGLLPGSYFLQASDFFRTSQLYDSIECANFDLPFGCDVTAGTPITVGFGDEAENIDFSLGFASGIISRVTHAETGAPLIDVDVVFWRDGGVIDRISPTREGVVEASLQPGTYYVYTDGFGGSDQIGIDEVWDDVPCPSTFDTPCDPTIDGTPIEITEGAVRTGIDFALEGFPLRDCQPSPDNLCLNNGRFMVTASWRTPDDRSGRAMAVPLTDESGYFWFFRPGNVEALVKVLDACGTNTPRFWVFAAGLTNLEVELTVVDTLSGEVNTYRNDQGTPYAPVQDTRAFDTCTPGFDAVVRPETEPASARQPLPRSKEGSGCMASDTVLCLGDDGRFRVEATWGTPDGRSGPARVEPLPNGDPANGGSGADADTGTMWFFRPDNVEVVVKVLDACTTSSNRFWVFAGGLTNLEVDLRVTDTKTGDVQVYRNPEGRAFQPILDTGAFATCDP